ncbi:MAG: AAA family ATPase [Deltaproteobacteria bacterium]|nr:AAA family ATPase [Deltaproteobacteria bacterium]
MYLEHYNLHTKPFQITADPRFLWLGENHKEALAVLKYGILDNKGFLLLTGDVGTGKTTLINALIESLGDDVITATVPDPDLDLIDFLNFIAGSFEINNKITSKGDFLFHFHGFLKNAFRNNKKVLLIIDESQRLKQDILEEIRMLSNIEFKNTKLINIFFVGQNEFNDLLWENHNRALRQRITVNYNVYPLKDSETFDYINHRLKIAGSQKQVFTRDAIREIISFSEGFPRTINIICDHALLSGYVKGVKKIDSKIVLECGKDLKIPRLTTQKEQKPEEGNSVNKVRSKGRLRIAAYTAVLIIFLVVMGSLLFQSNSTSLILKIDHFWSRIKSEFPKKTMDSIKVTPRTPSEQPAAENSTNGSLHLKKIKKTVPSNNIQFSKNEPNRPVQTYPDIEETKMQPLSHQDKMKPEETIKEKKIIVYFPHNSNEFSLEAIESLDRAAFFLKKNPEKVVNTVGYTDTSGAYSYNKSLSKFRANIVKSYLIGKGVDSKQIKSIGMGPVNPQGDNATNKGRKSNRRVEIIFD